MIHVGENPMESKARNNLLAATLLLEKQMYDSATSRAYYSAYLAGWNWMANEVNAHPQNQRDRGWYWPHRDFPKELLKAGALADEDQKDDMEMLFNGRVKADYYSDEISREEAEKLREIAAELVELLLGDEAE